MDRDELQQMYHRCFHTNEGMVVLQDLKNQFFNALMVGEDCNPNQLLFREGRRSVVLFIMAEMEEFEIRELEKRTPREDNNGG